MFEVFQANIQRPVLAVFFSRQKENFAGITVVLQ